MSEITERLEFPVNLPTESQNEECDYAYLDQDDSAGIEYTCRTCGEEFTGSGYEDICPNENEFDEMAEEHFISARDPESDR